MTSTPRRPVAKTIGSVSFDDPYDWLQHDSEESLAWQWQQDAIAEREARAWPHFETLKAQIRAADAGNYAAASTPPRLRGGRWFWMGPSPDGGIRTVLTGSGPLEGGRSLLAMADHLPAEDVATASVFWFQPSLQGDRVAMCIASHGEMNGQWHFVDVATGKALRAPVPATAITGGQPGWLPDGSGVYLHVRDPEGRHCIRFVPVGDDVPERPDAIFDFADVPANVAGLTLEVSPDGRHVIALAGPHERIAYMIGDTRTGAWRRFLPEHYEGEVSGAWLDADTYVARAHSDDFPRGRIVAIPAASSQDIASWRVIAPQGEAVLRAVGVTGGKITIIDVLHVSTRVRVIDATGGNERIAPIAAPASSWMVLVRRFDGSDALTFDYSTFTQSEGVYRLDVDSGALTTLSPPAALLDDMRIEQHFARSLDGTRIPYFMVSRDDIAFDQPRPALVYGYGGFNVALMPSFLAHLIPFIRAGGILIHANLRGGGEYGKHWHEGGRLAAKWNTYLDLFAVTERAIADGITSPDRLAFYGASNGGLLANIAAVHRPDLWRVVIPDVPLADMLEPLPLDHSFDPVRAIFFEDFGDPASPAISRIAHSYSPYHNVKEGVAYPAVFQVFGEKDLGCHPFHGRKFTAALQHASRSDRRILLRVWKGTGHGAYDPDIMLSQKTEWLGFVMAELGMTPAGAAEHLER